MEKIFVVVPCSEEQKVNFATFMLKGEAENWWRGAREKMVTTGIPLQWDNFKIVFLDKYFPQSERRQKEAEFLQLQQGDMTVGQYVDKFEELAKFSLYLQHLPNDEWKASKFEQGLKPEIQNIVGALEIRDYPTLVNKSRIVEKTLGKVQIDKQNTWKRKREDAKFHQNDRFKKEWNKGKNAMTGGSKVEGCPKCGKSHKGACLQGQWICYRCHAPGHLARERPMTKKGAGSEPKPQAKGRVFTLSGVKAKGVDNLIQGICFLNNEPLVVLFDSGAIHSFISCDCVKRLNLSVSSLPFQLSVTTPAKDEVLTSHICMNCSLVIHGKHFLVDLICLPLHGLDIILGMDWLSTNQVVLNCFTRTVEFPSSPIAPQLSITSLCVNASQFFQCVVEGGQVSVLLLSSKSEVKLELSTIPVVNEFEYVFPENVTTLPPEREVEFSIDLMPGAGPISIAPYRMSPLELSELKSQIEELISKQFIRPSVSPWGLYYWSKRKMVA